MEIVRLEHVYKEYPLGAHQVQALTDIVQPWRRADAA